MNEIKKAEPKVKHYRTYIVILVCLLIIMLSKYLDIRYKLSDNTEVKLFLQILESVNMAFLTGAFIGLIIDFEEWREYFGGHIRDLVVNHIYISKLSPERIDDLEKIIAKVRYDSNDADVRGSFFDYLKKRLYVLIKEPYRRDVSLGLKVRVNGDEIELFEALTYWCCPVGDKSIDTIYWTWDEDEVIDIESICLELTCYTDSDKTIKKSFDNEKLDIYKSQDQIEKGYIIELDNLLDPSERSREFCVKIDTSYKIKSGMFYSWKSNYASKNIHMTVSYEDCDLHRSIGGIKENEFQETHDVKNKFYEYHQSGWVLPHSNIVWQFKKPSEHNQELVKT